MTSQLPRFRGFFAAGSCEKDTENGAAVTSFVTTLAAYESKGTGSLPNF